MNDEPDLASLLHSVAGTQPRRPRRKPWDEEPDDPHGAWDEEPAGPSRQWQEEPSPLRRFFGRPGGRREPGAGGK